MVETICAISTSLGVGAISIIRMSGPEAINIINSIFKGPEITPQKNRTINYGKIIYNGEIVIPKSFSEDSWETISLNVKVGNIGVYETNLKENTNNTKEVSLIEYINKEIG